MEGQEIQQEIPVETTDAPVSAEETTSGVEETESPAVTDQEEAPGPDAAAQAQEAQEQQARRESKGVQKRIDELVRQREEANRRVDYLMGLVAQATKPQEQPQAKPQPVEEQPPKEDDFKSYEDFMDAKAEFKARKAAEKAAADAEKKVLSQVEAVLARERQTREAQAKSNAARAWVDAGVSKHADFAQTVLTDSVRITPHMEEIILSDPAGHEVAYYLGKNPAESHRIASLPPLRQAQELGRIAASVESKPTPPPQITQKTTSAPAPIRPSGSKAPVQKDPATMSMDEYRAWRSASKG